MSCNKEINMPTKHVVNISCSPSTISEAQYYNAMTERELAEEYFNLPMVPYNQNLRIDKIAVLNLDCRTKAAAGLLKYKTFRELDPVSFPPFEDPEIDYEEDEQVSPTIIISQGKRFKTDFILWYPLGDIIVNMMYTQGRVNRKLLPITVFVDDDNQWLVPLFNLSLGLQRPENNEAIDRVNFNRELEEVDFNGL